MVENLGLKKLKFYDSWGWVFITSIILIFVFLAIDRDFSFYLMILSSILTAISVAIITFGMLYHMIKRKETIWIIVFILSIFITGAWIVSFAFYGFKMRNRFKKGTWREGKKKKEIKIGKFKLVD
jgi:hypothetical protein